MCPELKTLLLASVLSAGIAAACAVIERGAAHPEPVAVVPAHTAAGAAEAAAATDARPVRTAAAAEAPPIDFTAEIQPIFEGCRPCHFEGGKMYAKLPFDDPATIRHLGEDLFTRIKDEDARAQIRAFLAQAAE